MTLHKQINWPGKLMNLTWIGYLSVYFPLLPATYGSSPFQQGFHLQYIRKKISIYKLQKSTGERKYTKIQSFFCYTEFLQLQ